ncbi:MAG TPA: hypothetical protein VLJ59_00100 [Mycobacteriales bacterium]|nr:hypothetical protein [Mycobacteriales bacterium]
MPATPARDDHRCTGEAAVAVTAPAGAFLSPAVGVRLWTDGPDRVRVAPRNTLPAEPPWR